MESTTEETNEYVWFNRNHVYSIMIMKINQLHLGSNNRVRRTLLEESILKTTTTQQQQKEMDQDQDQDQDDQNGSTTEGNGCNTKTRKDNNDDVITTTKTTPDNLRLYWPARRPLSSSRHLSTTTSSSSSIIINCPGIIPQDISLPNSNHVFVFNSNHTAWQIESYQKAQDDPDDGVSLLIYVNDDITRLIAALDRYDDTNDDNNRIYKCLSKHVDPFFSLNYFKVFTFTTTTLIRNDPLILWCYDSNYYSAFYPDFKSFSPDHSPPRHTVKIIIQREYNRTKTYSFSFLLLSLILGLTIPFVLLLILFLLWLAWRRRRRFKHHHAVAVAADKNHHQPPSNVIHTFDSTFWGAMKEGQRRNIYKQTIYKHQQQNPTTTTTTTDGVDDGEEQPPQNNEPKNDEPNQETITTTTTITTNLDSMTEKDRYQLYLNTLGRPNKMPKKNIKY